MRAYARCVPVGDVLDPGCLYTPTREVWTGLAETNRGGAPLSLTVRATDDAGAGVGTTTTQTLRFAPADVRGALYYWTTSQGSAVMRWSFGDSARREPERFAGPETTGDSTVFCVGCHALSHDGGKMVLGTTLKVAGDGRQPRRRRSCCTTSRSRAPAAPFPLAQRSTFEAWSPKDDAFVGVFGDGGEKDLLLFDGATGARTGTIPLGGAQAGHPDWSPDGKRIAYTDVGVTHIDQAPERGGISYVERPGDAQPWGAPAACSCPALAGKNRYYPAVAPDSSFLVYDESTCPPGKTYDRVCNADTDPSARLWAARLPAGVAHARRARRREPARRRRSRRDRSRHVVPEVESVRVPRLVDQPDPVADVLVAAPLRPAPLAAAGVDARGAAQRHAHLDGRHQSRAPGPRRGPQRAGVLPPLPGHRDLEPHRPMDERRGDRPLTRPP